MGSVIDTVVSIYMQMFWIITSLQNSKEKKKQENLMILCFIPMVID